MILEYISSPYGFRKDPLSGKRVFHFGRDIVTQPPDAPVYATGNGVVEEVSSGKKLGKYILIRHGYGFQTKYAHLKEAFVRKGQKVKAGQRIGRVGKSGWATAEHLHYEVLRDGVGVDPGGVRSGLFN